MILNQVYEISNKIQDITGASIVSFLGGLILTNLSSSPSEPYFSLKHIGTFKQITISSIILIYHLH